MTTSENEGAEPINPAHRDETAMNRAQPACDNVKKSGSFAYHPHALLQRAQIALWGLHEESARGSCTQDGSHLVSGIFGDLKAYCSLRSVRSHISEARFGTRCS